MTQTKILPRDTNAALKDVMRTITVLGAVFDEETKVLKKADVQGFLSIQDRKIRAAQMYESHMQQMIARKKELTMADPSLKEKLKAQYEDFSKTSAENLLVLERMQKNTNALGDRIRGAAIKAAQNQRGYSYSETGAIPNTSRKKAISSGHSETV